MSVFDQLEAGSLEEKKLLPEKYSRSEPDPLDELIEELITLESQRKNIEEIQRIKNKIKLSKTVFFVMLGAMIFSIAVPVVRLLLL